MSYESNFKNLLNNWKPQYITNAGLYEFTECSFVETITDSTRYNYYRNYFSGIEPVSKSKRGGYRVDHTGKRSHELYIEPGYAHREFFDQRGLSDAAKKLLTDELKAKAIDILTRKINIDTLNLFHYSYEKYKIDTIRGSDLKVFSYSKKWIKSKVASPDSISKNYIDIHVTREKSFDSLTTDEKRALILEELLIRRIDRQLSFNEKVNIGDRVYVISFKYNEELFSNYVVCSAESKKVVLDYFFKDIQLELKN
ncbi:MAG: hypothetical protein PHI32_14675 [Dysgonamonadaceae bacterium]|nr:hypothetical protein [Dysgonamonadaceae bacterium]